MHKILKTINLLDDCGLYRTADLFEQTLLKVSAFPYNLTSLDELPVTVRNIPWKKNVEDYEQYDNVFWEELKQRIPDYFGENSDSDDSGSLEDKMNGPDPVPGPAYVFPQTGLTSPSMSGGLEDYTWDQARDTNTGPEYYKNLLPRR